MNKVLSPVIAVILLLSTSVSMGEVTVIYSNFDQNMGYDTTTYHGYTINGFGSSPPPNPYAGQQAVSNKFTPLSTDNFLSAQVALVSYSGSSSSLNVVLQEDSSGLPGAVIESIPVTLTSGSTPTIYEAVSVLVPTLQAGTSYWLTVVANNQAMTGGWHWNSINDINVSNFAGTQDGSPLGLWGIDPNPVKRPVFQINGGAIINYPTTKDQCKKDGWQTYGFKNQGQCIQFVNTGK